ncbi:hypothetical protein TSUD_109440 [Trifolium subterraneum]|nr:hypothetical protein TSUD_109440 [Trifolium subterraneum]
MMTPMLGPTYVAEPIYHHHYQVAVVAPANSPAHYGCHHITSLAVQGFTTGIKVLKDNQLNTSL